MNKSRLEAFSDGVIAIIITIMVLEIKVPHSADWSALAEQCPVFLSYLLSFLFVGIYWGNHHHVLHTVRKVSGSIMWANALLLFCLSLIPFATAWMGETHFARNTVITYGLLLLLNGVAFATLQMAIKKVNTLPPAVEQALGSLKNKAVVSTILYSIAIAAAFYSTIISGVLFITVAIMWIIPDKKLEQALNEEQ